MIALLGAIFSTTACSDWLDVSPETEKKKEEMFSKESGYRSALIGAYIRLKSTSLYGGEMTHGTVEMLAQHWNNTSKGSKEYLLSLFDYRNSTVESSFSSIYNNLYKVIADVNAVLEDIDANKDIFKENNYELIKAEALALRNDTLARGSKDLNESFDLVKAVYYRSNPYKVTSADSITYSAGSAESLQELVLEERQRELAFEGKRWFDLVRKALRDGETGPMLDILINHKYETNQKAIRSKMSAMDCLFFPISEREIKTNPLLKQNPAYETEDVYEKN